MSNILEALVNIVENKDYEIKQYTTGSNRAQNMGEALEQYILDSYCNSFKIIDEDERLEEHRKVFSFLGSKSKMPDAIVRGAEALEIKKSSQSTVQLNSSSPKHTLKCSNKRIAASARICEDKEWIEREMLYCFGYIPSKKNLLKSIWFVYGRIFCDLQEVYEVTANKIESNLEELQDEDTETNELGRINNVDNLKITYLRIRGMWVIKHPQKVFSKLVEKWGNNDFEVKALIPKTIFDEFPQSSKDKLNASELITEDIKLPDPTNRAKTLDCVFIYYK
ncbi:NgoPII family restriction endonuclease [Lacinutrix chionoecetis]